MKNRRKFACIIGVIMLVLLNGCSLAVSDAGEDGGGDHLIGAFITSEYLDLYDMDAYLNNHASELMNGKEITVTDTFGYEQRLYASIDKSSGGDYSGRKISFGDFTGINFFSPLGIDDDGEKYWASVYDEGVCDTDVSVNISDTEEEHNLSGTIYILPGKADEDIVYFVNPVYQTSDGRIYAVPGQGFSTSGDSSEGECFAATLSGEITATENGKTKTERSSVTVNIAIMYRPIGITLYQMDKEHQIVRKEKYKPDEFPEKIMLESETEYVLVEIEKEKLSGEKMISRKVYDYKEELNTLEIFYALENGIVAERETEINWKNTENE